MSAAIQQAAIDHRELLKKFIIAAGGDSDRCQVLRILDGGRGYDEVPFTEQEKDELLALKAEAVEQFL